MNSKPAFKRKRKDLTLFQKMDILKTLQKQDNTFIRQQKMKEFDIAACNCLQYGLIVVK